ncbi:aryl-sulfate sulfotransferase [Lactiplantibacillus plantarum]|uniref:aryl-sulfate sulfotransferase n=1 Tax=Lactiplantibacillus plantarum TaxID=1590 RepID=UPI001E51BC69|nr:aryl-sulfate sulfotransferase [Lactiplantibacillus plantarum]MCC6118808.1 aryl-sulfate sulfotransferase [Lactiplantibacillus plantarum]MCT3240020.1 aryl-sulfate sulfotransferase [Lactiplantibacillus plantarum]MCW6135291.1 aryl-sulfate sulfotransferase [Lactiplantibacillus plantarum]
MKKRNWLIALIVVVIVAIGGGFGYYKYHQSTATTTTTSKVRSASATKKDINTRLVKTEIKTQSSETATLKKAVANKNYTVNNMYTKVNPYGVSPLSAKVIFQTSKAAKVSYTVVGKSSKTSISNTVNKYTTSHDLTVLGLYANTNNQVKIKVTYKDGTSTTKTIRLKTAKLPSALTDFKINVKKANKQKMVLGTGNSKLTFMVRTTISGSKQSKNLSFGMDADGNIRWYTTRPTSHIFKQLNNGHLLIWTKSNAKNSYFDELVEMDYTGKVYKTYKFNHKAWGKAKGSKKQNHNQVHHDVTELPNGDLIATVSDGGRTYVEDTMIVISHKTGKITKVINMKNILPAKFYTKYNATKSSKYMGKKDWFHQNSVYYDKTDKSLIISSRNQNLVMKIDYKTEKIKWILSGKKTSAWPKSYRKYLLKASSKIAWPGGQHAAIVDPSTLGKKNSLNVMIFNNNVAVGTTKKSLADSSGKYSEGVEYHINEKTKTISQVGSYGKSLGKKNFANIIGSNRYLSASNRLIDFGWLNNGKSANIIEYDLKSKQQVFNVELTGLPSGGYVYRAERFSLYPTKHTYGINE